MDTGAPTLRSPILSNLAVISEGGGPNQDKPRLVVWVVRKNSAAKPSNTNEPVPRFNVRDLRIRTLLQKRCGNQIVQEQNHHGRGNDRASGGSTDALRSGRGIISLINGNETAGKAEGNTLDDALGDVRQADGGAHLRPKAAGVDPHDLHADQLRAIDAD